MGLIDNLKNFVSEGDDEEETTTIELSEEEANSMSGLKTPYEGDGNSLDPNASIALFEPRNLRETEDVGRLLKNDKACFVNLSKLPMEYRQRAIDFLSGVIFGIGGYKNMVGQDLVLFSPKKLKVTGKVTMDQDPTQGE